MMKFFVFATLLVLLVQAQNADLNLNPVIGIYTEPSSYKEYPSSKYSYIASSYVKWAEMAGAQVVPIFYDADQAYYDEVFDSVNGILFPGGSVDLSKGKPFGDNAAYLIQKAIDANDRGVFYPIWGTCLGWELLATVISDFNPDVLSHIDNEANVKHPIKFVAESPITESMPDFLKIVSQTEPVWFFNHEYCVLPQTFQEIPALDGFFEIVATAKNDQGVEFIALSEAKSYPIWGTQFHPEKNNFEWRVPANHDVNAIMSSQYLANYFVEQSRKNNHKYTTNNALQEALIYNYPSVVIPPAESSFSEIYVLPNWSAKSSSQQQQNQPIDTQILPEKIEDTDRHSFLEKRI